MRQHGEELVLLAIDGFGLGTRRSLQLELHLLLTLHALPVGHVTDDLGQSAEAFAGDGGHHPAAVDSPAILALMPPFVFRPTRRLCGLTFATGDILRAILRREDQIDGLAEYFLFVITEHALRAPVPANDPAIQILDDDRVVVGSECGKLEALFPQTNLLLRK